MSIRTGTSLSLLICALLGTTAAALQERGGRGGAAPDKGAKDSIQPYDEVLGEGTESDPGLFLVHRKDDKVFYEIPRKALGVDMLWVTQVEKTQAGFGYGGTGVGNRVVRWELRGEKVLLRDIKYSLLGDDDANLRQSVEATSLAPIIQTFPVKAWGKDQAPVIDATGLFLEDLPEFSPKRRLDASGMDKDRTFLESIRSFPTNIETKVLATYKLSERQPGTGGFDPRRRSDGPRRDPTQGAVTVLLHHSMVRLPEVPMTPRVHDDRVGFFRVSFTEFDTDEHQTDDLSYITRWRLEKKDPTAEVSEPTQPIVFYVGRGVPEKWRPYVKQGIEMWQPAFEAAGFRNAILGMDPPSRTEDPDWDAEDARYSSIRWLPSTTENAMGPHVNDPRTGEILEADIVVYHNVLKLIRDWYFVQASPNDPRAQVLPLPDEVIGECLAYVIAHEVGHSLGFPHNMKASSSYTVEQLRDPEFTKKYGTEASIMDYGRFNYVAQPGDGAALIPTIGPYDFFAVDWGYRQYADGEAEAQGLRALVAKQVDDPMLRFGDPNAGEDPSQQTEDLGSDPMRSTELGLENLKRVAANLVDACCKEGEDYDLLRNMYEQVANQRDRELGHVASLVGGFVRQNLWYGDADTQYLPVSADRQRAAVAFLNERAFETPQELLDANILQRLDAGGVADGILSSQQRLLGSLVSDARIKRMAEHATFVDGAYLPLQLLEDLRGGIWRELDQVPVQVDLYRRNLQRAFVDLLVDALESEEVGSDLPALARGQLTAIQEHVNQAGVRRTEPTTKLHLEHVRAVIREALSGEHQRAQGAGATTGGSAGR